MAYIYIWILSLDFGHGRPLCDDRRWQESRCFSSGLAWIWIEAEDGSSSHPHSDGSYGHLVCWFTEINMERFSIAMWNYQRVYDMPLLWSNFISLYVGYHWRCKLLGIFKGKQNISKYAEQDAVAESSKECSQQLLSSTGSWVARVKLFGLGLDQSKNWETLQAVGRYSRVVDDRWWQEVLECFGHYNLHRCSGFFSWFGLIWILRLQFDRTHPHLQMYGQNKGRLLQWRGAHWCWESAPNNVKR